MAISTATTRPRADAAIALAFAAGGGSASCNLATVAAADISGDGWVTALDTLMILQGWMDDIHNYRKTINTLKKVRRKLK